MNKVQKLMRLRDTGHISLWSELGRGLFGLRTFCRDIDGGEDCVVLVRGREPRVAWVVVSAGATPTNIFAAGSAPTHVEAQSAADTALELLDVNTPSTYIPVVDGDTRALLSNNALMEDAVIHTRVYSVKGRDPRGTNH
jgi:hypothetical protein